MLVVGRIFLFPGTCIHTTGPQKTRQILRKAQKIRHVDSIIHCNEFPIYIPITKILQDCYWIYNSN